eukprot:2191020-Pyramimonas_sp.AAC.1
MSGPSSARESTTVLYYHKWLRAVLASDVGPVVSAAIAIPHLRTGPLREVPSTRGGLPCSWAKNEHQYSYNWVGE